MISRQTLAQKRGEIEDFAHARRIANVRVFGSVARGDNTEISDVDLVVKTLPGCSLFDLGGFLMDAEEALGCAVDVVSEASLKPHLRARVLAEAIPL